jgi:periplasmic protein CpxP/Spy
MFEIRHSARTLAAAAALLSAGALAAPAGAQTNAVAPSTTQPSASTAAPSASATTHAKRSPVDRVEARIAQLHRELKITPEQQPQWDALAQVMRDNAQQMETALKARAQTVSTGTAVDDLHSYEVIADAHADGLKKFVPAFEALYNTMSDDQKKTTDAVFREHQRHGRSATKKS